MVVGSARATRAVPLRPHAGRPSVSASCKSHKPGLDRKPGPDRRNDALCAPIGDSCHARPLPWGVGATHRILRLVAVACLARYGASLAGATFSPAAQPLVKKHGPSHPIPAEPPLSADWPLWSEGVVAAAGSSFKSPQWWRRRVQASSPGASCQTCHARSC